MDTHQIIRIVQDTSNCIEIYDHKGRCIGAADCYDEQELKEVLWGFLKPSESKVGLALPREERNE